MEWIIWLFIMAPVSSVFTGIGIYAMKRKKPMWFWSGTVVSENEISDVSAYNRANGVMWILFSLVFWVCAIMGVWNMRAAGICLITAGIGGCIVLPFAYQKIYDRHRNTAAQNEKA